MALKANGSLLIKNCKGILQIREVYPTFLKGIDLSVLPSLENGYILIKNGLVDSFGVMSDLPEVKIDEEIDATDRYVLPAFVDSHTHLVFATSRESEFVDKIKGLSYSEIAEKGGGILNSAEKLRKTSEKELIESATLRLQEAMSTGTGAVEIKSGYGLDTASEIKMLRVIKSLSENSPVTIKATFLGAHAFPKSKSRESYIREIKEEMIPEIARQNLAEYIDVFCEKGFFSIDESEDILNTGIKYGLKPKIHANQLTNNGGVQLGVKIKALSVDHLESIADQEILELGNSEVIPTLLPGAAFFLRMPYPPARKMIDSGLGVAIASDFNPGSSPTSNMQLMISLACIGMKMTPTEALNASTVNSSH
ncbi:MAG: imidazolonepropionase, partial [Cyclobacteriaceae bacterium]|nr:imidazolonepropionase [Cyclobacteriaceae bacterium]